jgi:hypothetical protein
VPGPQCAFLINPFGLMYHGVTTSNLVAVDIEFEGITVNPDERARMLQNIGDKKGLSSRFPPWNPPGSPSGVIKPLARMHSRFPFQPRNAHLDFGC